MAKLEAFGLSLALALMLPGPYAGAADEIRGKVVSITLTDDCSPQGECAANIALAADDGKMITFHVRPNATEILRGSKGGERAIHLSQLGIGSIVRIPDYDEVIVKMHRPKRIYMEGD